MNNSSIIKSHLTAFLDKYTDARLFCEGTQDTFYQTIPCSEDLLRPSQLEELPISEAAAIGLVTGASMFGIRPIVCFQRVEFGLLAIDQLVTNSSKTKYLSGGKLASPFLLRMVIGRGWGQGPCHSQSFESIWGSIPGLDVYMPATSSDYIEVFSRFESSDSPIISLEHRWTHLTNSETTVGCINANSLVTIVSTSYNSILATKVSSYLQRFGVSVDVIHIFSLNRFPDQIFESIARTKRLITMDLGTYRLGPSSELLAQLAERGVSYSSPPVRLGSPFSPAPACPEAASTHFLSAESLFDTLETLLPSHIEYN